jgi:putative component of membrane protein insertase Oxa1/YidC/SpoIIIJ protein YidD
MFQLQKPAVTGEPEMSTLRKRLGWRRPEPYLAVWVIALFALAFDCARLPEAQWTARRSIDAIRWYQRYGRPVSRSVIACRYRPTCSEYSVEAVGRFGVIPGLRMSLQRIASCDRSVMPGTSNPIARN